MAGTKVASAVLRYKDVAEQLGCSTRTVERLRDAGRIGYFTVGLGSKPRVFFTQDHVDAYIESTTRHPVERRRRR
jgi:excisionase family DNA binding protein